MTFSGGHPRQIVVCKEGLSFIFVLIPNTWNNKTTCMLFNQIAFIFNWGTWTSFMLTVCSMSHCWDMWSDVCNEAKYWHFGRREIETIYVYHKNNWIIFCSHRCSLYRKTSHSDPNWNFLWTLGTHFAVQILQKVLKVS